MPEAVLFVGPPGAGKSSLYRERFYDTHVRINLDMIRTRDREDLLLRACIDGRQSFVIDNTNTTRLIRSKYIKAAGRAGFDMVAYVFEISLEDCLRRNAERRGRKRVPDRVVKKYHSQLQEEPPRPGEGFQQIYRVILDAKGRLIVKKSRRKA